MVPPRGLLDRLDGEVAVRGRLPADALCDRTAGLAAQHFDPLGDDECGIEADPELADELRILLRVAGELAEELGGAGFGDGAQVAHGLLAAHADAVVADPDGAGGGVGLDPDAQRLLVAREVRVGQRQEPQLVVGVGGVGDQLPQEDLAVAVEGMDHELEQLTDFRLESECLGGGGSGFGHRLLRHVRGQCVRRR